MSDKKSPFASLAALKTALPEGALPPPKEPPKKDEPFEAKVVVSKSRKGRGGKTVTMVTGVKVAARENVCRDLKKALGCGATIEDDAIVVGGEVGDRVRAWLEQHGARRIVMGN